MVSFAREEPAVLGREILGSEFSYVSRRQAVVSLEADDTVRLESVGANPTGIRAAGETKWRWLSKGQTAELSVGDEVALSRKVSAHSTLTLVAPSLLAIGSKQPAVEADVGTRAVAKAADASMAGAATSSQSVQWRWKSGSGWSDFSPSQSAAIEDAFVRGESAVAIDEERQVDLQQMRQLRFDDPSRFREVKRFPSKRSLTNTTGTADTNPDVPTLAEEPAAKRARTTVKGEGSAAPVMPSDAAPDAAPAAAPSAPTAAFTAASDSIDASTAVSISTAFTASTCKFTAASSANAASSTSASTTSASTAAAAVQSLTPCDVPHSKKARWFPAHGEVLVRRADEEPRSKVAAFDMDGTLLQWKCKGYPSRLGDYELWSAEALETMRKLHGEGHKLVILSNQGGVRGAFTGKIATRFKGLVEWLEAQLQRPLHALAATIPKVSAYRKPATGMWSAMEEHTNGGVKVSIEDSLFVGDMAGRAGDASSSDRDFASNVGSERGAVLPFLTPEAAFGPAAEHSPRKEHVRARRGLPPSSVSVDAAVQTSASPPATYALHLVHQLMHQLMQPLFPFSSP
ncbi:hypothetical protein AB1Y20_008260 [Prymnesium parvum]|uniref:WWE domain-containing protein n=1 Tax=Prymnesium parvum TaxID=97485 RepID=A0AB34IUC5_PRYPA